MRVLWLSKSPSRYAQQSGRYNGLGWVSSLEELVREEVSLAIAFPTSDANAGQKTIEGVEYYPVFDPTDNKGSRLRKLLFGHEYADKIMVSKYLEVIKDFNPDVIQIFGTEYDFGLIAPMVKCPVLLHVQGLLKPCFDNYLPGSSWSRYIFSAGSPGKAFQRIYTRSRWKYAVKRETRIISLVNNYLCRTGWDRSLVSQANPKARIFRGEEVLRPAFYDAPQWNYKEVSPKEGRPVIVTTISEAPYKGLDVVLRAGKALKEDGIDFEWKVFGNVDLRFAQKTAGISCQDAGVSICGVVTAEELAGELSACTLYVHPSYIENSCNSICEAQMIGVPVIAANVGGIPSLIDNGHTGMLFPAGSASALAMSIETLLASDKESLSEFSRAARSAALSRHDRPSILSSLLDTYQALV